MSKNTDPDQMTKIEKKEALEKHFKQTVPVPEDEFKKYISTNSKICKKTIGTRNREKTCKY